MNGTMQDNLTALPAETDLQNKSKTLRLICVTVMLSSVYLLIVILFNPSVLHEVVYFVTSNFLLAMVAFFINRAGYVDAASRIFLVTYLANLLFGGFWIGGGALSPAVISTIVVIFWIGILESRRFVLCAALFTTIVGYVYAFTQAAGIFTPKIVLHNPFSFWTIMSYNLVVLVITQRLIVRQQHEGIVNLGQEIQERRKVETSLSVLNRKLRLLVDEKTAALKRERDTRFQLQQLNQTRDDFLAAVSHELRTPLTAICGWSEILTEGLCDQNTEAFALATMQRNTKQQLSTIESLLDLSLLLKGELTLKKVPSHIQEIVQAVVHKISSTALEKNIQIHIHSDEKPLSVVGDPVRIFQIFEQVLGNAIKFSPPTHPIDISIFQEGVHIVTEIGDHGIGIDAVFLPHVFDRFAQADTCRSRRYGGLGIGLAISKHLVELHGGQIFVTSAGLGQGTVFSIVLPKERRAAR